MSPIVLLRPKTVVIERPRPQPGVINTLGRGRWSAKLYTRGGVDYVGDLQFSGLTGERVRGTTPSEASVTVPNASTCMPLVSNCKPWLHELHLFRGGIRQWLGPIRRLEFQKSGDVILRASDITKWPEKTPLRSSVWFDGDAAQVYAALLELGIPASVGAQIIWAPLGVQVQKTYHADGVAALVGPQLTDLANLGVVASVVERLITIGPPVQARAIRLLDGHFSSLSDVVIDGDSQVNDALVAGGVSSPTYDPVLVEVRDEASIATYEALAAVDRDASTVTDEMATARGTATVTRQSEAPVQFTGGDLDVSAPVEFRELAPGATVGVTLTKSPAPVAGDYDLSRVTWSASPQSETISIEVQPPASSS